MLHLTETSSGLATFAITMTPTEQNSIRLSRLEKGRRAIIISHEEGDLQLPLLEMGCIPGEPVSIEMVAPLGDPLAIKIAGYYLSVRKEDAEKIWVCAV